MEPHSKPSKQVIWRSLWVTGSGRKKERDEVTTRLNSTWGWDQGLSTWRYWAGHQDSWTLVLEYKKFSVHFLQKGFRVVIRFSMDIAPNGSRTALLTEGSSASRERQKGVWGFFFLTSLVFHWRGQKISYLYFSSSIFQMELKSQNSKPLAESCGVERPGPKIWWGNLQQVTLPGWADFVVDEERTVTHSHTNPVTVDQTMSTERCLLSIPLITKANSIQPSFVVIAPSAFQVRYTA